MAMRSHSLSKKHESERGDKKPCFYLNNDQEVIEDDDENEVDDDEGEQKQSANHSSRILVEVPVEVRQLPVPTFLALSCVSLLFKSSPSLY